MNSFEKRLIENAHLINDALDNHLPEIGLRPEKLHEAMRYSTLAGGKRLRPTLVIEAAKLFGLSYEKVLPTACGIEMIYTYSLIHDDLPSMDNDDLRRGKPTCHKVFGEAMAILAGDALLTEAFSCIAKNAYIDGISPKAVLEVIEKTALACGSQGMVAGQAIDILSVNNDIDEETLYYISNQKTGALISLSLWAGARLAEAPTKELEIMLDFGKKIGLLFQLVDDILDVTGDVEILGKPVGSDAKNAKNTFLRYYGYDKTRQMMDEIARDAKILISKIDNVDFFIKMVDFILTRRS